MNAPELAEQGGKGNFYIPFPCPATFTPLRRCHQYNFCAASCLLACASSLPSCPASRKASASFSCHPSRPAGARWSLSFPRRCPPPHRARGPSGPPGEDAFRWCWGWAAGLAHAASDATTSVVREASFVSVCKVLCTVSITAKTFNKP